MGLEKGHWYSGDWGWRIYVANETVCLHFDGQCDDFDFLRQMQEFRDYVKEAFESGRYKENEKYLSKSLKCYNLWILDFLSKVRLNENLEPVAGKYLRGGHWDFDMEKQMAYMKFKDYIIQIGYDISNEYEKYYYSFSVLDRNENKKGSDNIKLHKQMEEACQEVKKILEKTSYKNYLKKIK